MSRSQMAGQMFVGDPGDLPGDLTHEVSECGTVLTSIYRDTDTELVVKGRWRDPRTADPRIGAAMRSVESRLPQLLDDPSGRTGGRWSRFLGRGTSGGCAPLTAWRLSRTTTQGARPEGLLREAARAVLASLLPTGRRRHR